MDNDDPVNIIPDLKGMNTNWVIQITAIPGVQPDKVINVVRAAIILFHSVPNGDYGFCMILCKCEWRAWCDSE